MAIPIDDDPIEPTDEQPVSPDVAAPDNPPDSLEVPEPDALEQEQETAPGWRIGRRSTDPEAPIGDAIDQATEVPEDDGDDWGR